jgi:DNA-directed DNA polymerase III PolC
MTFVPLRVRSHGSLLWGTAAPAALVERALALGYRALALTDRDNLYLAIAFDQAARAAGLVPLVGAEVTGHAAALLLALDRRGYASLCAVLTARHLDADFDLVRALGESHAGLHVVVESPGLAAALLATGVPAAVASECPHAGGLWLGVRGTAGDGSLPERLAAARRLGVPLVATGDVVMLEPGDWDTHRAAVTAAAGDLLERMPPSAFAARDAWLAGPAEWERRLRAACAAARAPEAAEDALANNAALVACCHLEIETGVPIFPRVALPNGETEAGRLRCLAAAGLARRYRGTDALRAARVRLGEELGVIERLGFAGYFLLVAGIVDFARARGIPAMGRGSGASSIVSYLLGITDVDPLRHGLCFERFLHPQRRDCPDLDIDLCWRRREEVVAHVYEAHGRDRVARIATHATLGARSAFRETAKVLGVPNARVNALARLIPRELAPPYLERLERLPEARFVPWREPRLAAALRLAERLDGAPRHLSVHCGGIVVGDRPLTWYVPLERAAGDLVITQFEMRAIERIGLVKLDLLGNRALSTIAECVTLAGRDTGVAAPVVGPPRGATAAEAVPEDDPATAARVAAGDTLGCFQLESPAMRHLLRMLRARTLEDTIAAVALVRPGAAGTPARAAPGAAGAGTGMKEAFCRRHRGLEPDAFHHPDLVPVLGGTHGVMLYEEDVMRVAAALTGISLAAGDDLRRAIGAAHRDEEFRALERGFVAQAARRGVAAAAAHAVWCDLVRFAAYAFCKAHAAGYGALGWRSAYFRTHFPTEWAVGILNHHAGMYATWVHVENLRRGTRESGSGVTFLPPCVNRSSWETTLEASAVRVGLGRVFGLARATGGRIVVERAHRPFRSLADFADRVRPTLPELEALVLAGALDVTGRTRPSLLLEARVSASARVRVRPPALVMPDGADLAPAPVPPVATPDLPEFGVAEQVRGEWRTTGLWFSGHPLDALVDPRTPGIVPAAEAARHIGRRVAVAGLSCARRRVETRGGETMLFLTLADRSGLVECVLLPGVYRAHAPATRATALRVEGRVEVTLDAITLDVERVVALA